MSEQTAGKVIDIRLNVGSGKPMQVVQSAEVSAGEGLVGDRHARQGNARQVLMVDRAVLEKFSLQAGDLRENVTVDGVDVENLEEGDELTIGDVEFTVGGLCDPCDYIDGLRPGLREAIDGERGLFISPVTGGTVSVGDRLEVSEHGV